MKTALIEKKIERGVLWLTLSNQEQRNPLSSDMLTEVTASLEMAYATDEVRCIVIAAKGPVFSAGHDLSEMAKRPEESKAVWQARVLSILELCATMMQRIVHGPKAVIPALRAPLLPQAVSWSLHAILPLRARMRPFVRLESTWVHFARRRWWVLAETFLGNTRSRWP